MRACVADEENHLRQMIAFIKARGIDKALRAIHAKALRGEPVTATDWIPVARPYNGEKYYEHNYHGRLAAACISSARPWP